jgi:hypothetical protein
MCVYVREGDRERERARAGECKSCIDTQTHRARNTETQTHGHTDTETHRDIYTDTQTHRHTDTPESCGCAWICAKVPQY